MDRVVVPGGTSSTCLGMNIFCLPDENVQMDVHDWAMSCTMFNAPPNMMFVPVMISSLCTSLFFSSVFWSLYMPVHIVRMRAIYRENTAGFGVAET